MMLPGSNKPSFTELWGIQAGVLRKVHSWACFFWERQSAPGIQESRSQGK